MAQLTSNRSRGLIIAAAIAIALVAAALSYWTAGGSGTATATVDNPQNITVTPFRTPGDPVSPGESAAVRAVATNPNPYEVHIASIALDTKRGTGGFDVDPDHSGCDVSALSFATQDNGGAGWTVPPRVGATNGTLVIGMPTALTMGAGAADECQGASFNVYLEASF